MRRALAIAGILFFSVQAFGDAPLTSPSRVERWSPNRRYVAVADPKKDVITVYQAEGTTRKELWRRDGWERAFDLADDGEHLVVCYGGLNLLPLNYETSWTMLSFYRHGVAFRRWSVRELIQDLSKLKKTVSHYYWGYCVGFDSNSLYEVQTVDRGRLRFDVRIGEMAR
jgi:hypothetical protein